MFNMFYSCSLLLIFHALVIRKKQIKYSTGFFCLLECNFIMHILNANYNKLFISYVTYMGNRDSYNLGLYIEDRVMRFN